MSNKAHIYTEKAPAAIGPYSQAVKVNNTIYLSGQIPLDSETMELIDGDIQQQARQVFANLEAVCKAAGSDLSGIVKLNIFLTDLSNFAAVNEVMQSYMMNPILRELQLVLKNSLKVQKLKWMALQLSSSIS